MKIKIGEHSFCEDNEFLLQMISINDGRTHGSAPTGCEVIDRTIYRAAVEANPCMCLIMLWSGFKADGNRGQAKRNAKRANALFDRSLDSLNPRILDPLFQIQEDKN